MFRLCGYVSEKSDLFCIIIYKMTESSYFDNICYVISHCLPCALKIHLYPNKSNKTNLARHQHALINNIFSFHLEMCSTLASERLLLEVDLGFGLFSFHISFVSLSDILIHARLVYSIYVFHRCSWLLVIDFNRRLQISA